MTLSELLRNRRDAKALTLQEVGDAAGIGKGHLHDLESGRQRETAMETPKPTIRQLAGRLQDAAYNHGCIDSKDYSSDKKYADAFDKSEDALRALMDAVDDAMAGKKEDGSG